MASPGFSRDIPSLLGDIAGADCHAIEKGFGFKPHLTFAVQVDLRDQSQIQKICDVMNIALERSALSSGKEHYFYARAITLFNKDAMAPQEYGIEFRKVDHIYMERFKTEELHYRQNARYNRHLVFKPPAGKAFLENGLAQALAASLAHLPRKGEALLDVTTDFTFARMMDGKRDTFVRHAKHILEGRIGSHLNNLDYKNGFLAFDGLKGINRETIRDRLQLFDREVRESEGRIQVNASSLGRLYGLGHFDNEFNR